jgi:hypothetical protein
MKTSSSGALAVPCRELYMEGFTPVDLPQSLPVLTELTIKTGSWTYFDWSISRFQRLDYPKLKHIVIDDHLGPSNRTALSFEFLGQLVGCFVGKFAHQIRQADNIMRTLTIDVLHTDSPEVRRTMRTVTSHRSPIRKVFSCQSNRLAVVLGDFRQINGVWTPHEGDVWQ